MDALTKKYKDYTSPEQSYDAESDEEVNAREQTIKSIQMEQTKEKVLSRITASLRGPHEADDFPS